MHRTHSTQGDAHLIEPDVTFLIEQLSGVLAGLTRLGARPPADAGPDDESERVAPAELAIAIQKMRRRREALFPDLFADAAWDILLDLYIATTKGRRVSVSSACIAAAVPATTALRHIALLADRGLISKAADDHDGRKCYVALTEDAQTRMGALLQMAGALIPALIR